MGLNRAPIQELSCDGGNGVVGCGADIDTLPVDAVAAAADC